MNTVKIIQRPIKDFLELKNISFKNFNRQTEKGIGIAEYILDLKDQWISSQNRAKHTKRLKFPTRRANTLYFIAARKSEATVTKTHNPMLWLKGCQTPIKFLRYVPASDA